MFKKRERPQSSRKLESDEGDGQSGVVPETVKDKRARQPGSVATSSSDGSKGIAASSKRSEESETAVITGKQADVALSGIKAAGESILKPKDDIVRTLDVDTDAAQDTRAILERNQEIHKGIKEGALEKGIYRGAKGYVQYLERGEGAISNSKYSGNLGPTRNSLTNVRSTLRIEFWGTTGEGGLCKDYKETGYCGWGDSCKFAHDRSDYKPGYILEREWEEKQKAIETRKRKEWEKKLARMQAAMEKGVPPEQLEDDDSEEAEESSDEDCPSTCYSCGQKWEHCKSIPVVTACGHHFCEDCAMANFAKSPRCDKCGAPTNGTFNSSDKLEDKLKKKKAERDAKKAEKTSLLNGGPQTVRQKRNGASLYGNYVPDDD